MHFGFLVAREYAGKGYWKCQCLNCGKDKLVKGEHLRLGNVKSCGCLKEEQETRGKRDTNSYVIRTHKGDEKMCIRDRYTMPAFPAQDIINALAIGIVSGLAATGVNQAIKQIKQ